MRENIPYLKDFELEVFEFACYICGKCSLLLALFTELEGNLSFEISYDFGIGQTSYILITEVVLRYIVKLPPCLFCLFAEFFLNYSLTPYKFLLLQTQAFLKLYKFNNTSLLLIPHLTIKLSTTSMSCLNSRLTFLTQDVTSTITEHSLCSFSLILSIMAHILPLSSFVSGRVSAAQLVSLNVREMQDLESKDPKADSSCSMKLDSLRRV